MEGWVKVVSQDEIAMRRRKLAGTLCKDWGGHDIVLCCILKGAMYFATDLSRDLDDLGVDHTVYCVEASSYKGEAQQERVELLSKLVPEKFKNRHVILVDELYDNGKTMYSVQKHLIDVLKLSPSDISTCVMFQKKRAVTCFAPPAYVGMAIPDVWLVGYGMDHYGTRRGLRDVWAKPKPKGESFTGDDWRVFACAK